MIRDGLIEDLPRITVIRTSVRENHMSVSDLAAHGISEASIAAEMGDGGLRCWVAEESGEIVAFAMAKAVTAKVWALFTLPGFEGRGHGGALLKRCEAWLKTRGHAIATLDTGADTSAVGFYQRRGWRIVRRRDDPPDSVDLEKIL